MIIDRAAHMGGSIYLFRRPERARVYGGSDNTLQAQSEEYAGGKEEEDDNGDAGLLFALHGRAVAGALRDELRRAQGADDGLVEQEGGGHVEAALDGVEGQENGQEQVGYGLAGLALVDGREEVVPGQHDGYEQHYAGQQAEHGAGQQKAAVATIFMMQPMGPVSLNGEIISIRATTTIMPRALSGP